MRDPAAASPAAGKRGTCDDDDGKEATPREAPRERAMVFITQNTLTPTLTYMICKQTKHLNQKEVNFLKVNWKSRFAKKSPSES